MRAVRIYLALTFSILPRPRSLFVSPRRPSCSLSKTTLSFFLCRVIIDATALWEGATPCTRSIGGVVMSTVVLRKNWSVSKVLVPPEFSTLS